jgi:hypothetical protein
MFIFPSRDDDTADIPSGGRIGRQALFPFNPFGCPDRGGKICRDEFMKLDADLDMAIHRIQNAALADTSVVTVGFYYFFSRDKIIVPIMNSLYEKFPDVNFKISLYNFRRCGTACWKDAATSAWRSPATGEDGRI